MRIVKVEDISPPEVREIYAKRLSILQAVIADMDREDRERGARLTSNKQRTAGDLLAYCRSKSAPPPAAPVVPSIPHEAGAR